MSGWICPKCKEPVSLGAFYREGHVTGNCPLTRAQRDQLGGVEEE